MHDEVKSTGLQSEKPKDQEAGERRFLGLELWQQFVAGIAVAAFIAGIGFAVREFEGSSKNLGSTQGQTGSPTPTSVSTTTGPSTPSQEPVEFFNLNENEKVGALIQPLEVTGTVQTGEHAWILVVSSGAYYIQGALKSESADFWTLPTVSLGSATGPINVPYIVEVVMVDTQANRVIESDYSKTGDGNTGIATIPDGANVIRSITVIRTH